MFKEYDMQQKNGMSAAITMKDWLILQLMSLLSIIPIIGVIAYLGIYIYLAFNRETAVSIRNYLKLSLIVAAVVFVLTFAIILIGGASLAALASAVAG